MKNAHERFGVLEYTKRMKDTTTRIRLRVDRFVGEVDTEGTCKGHLISVLGGDSDVGAIWAAVVEQNHFTVEAPGAEPLVITLGEGAQCFRGTINVGGRRPIRHLVAISAELAKTRPGMDPEGRRTILCDKTRRSCFIASPSGLDYPWCQTGPSGLLKSSSGVERSNHSSGWDARRCS